MEVASRCYVSTRSVTDKLQRVFNAAARLVSGTRKFDRGLSRLLHNLLLKKMMMMMMMMMHVDLHWLDVPELVQYKLGVSAPPQLRRCQQHTASQYLIDCVTPASDIASRQRLRSASRHQLFVCRVTNSAHLVVGPSLDQRLGIRCRLISVIRRVVTSLSDVH